MTLPFDAADVARKPEIFAGGYEKARNDKERRLCGQLEILMDMANALGLGANLRPVNRLLMDLCNIERGTVSAMLNINGWRATALHDYEYRARLAAATEILRNDSLRDSADRRYRTYPKAARKIKNVANAQHSMGAD
jgi:hypothetical protein